MAVKILVGSILGFLTGLGIGGGSLLILWLTLVMNTDPSTARSINLLFFLPSALIACCFRWKQGSLPFRKLLPAICAGCVSAAVFSLAALRTDPESLKKYFGILLIFTGLRELMYKPKKQ